MAAVLETPRLSLRQLARGDEAFILELLNSPGFLNNIGDRFVRTAEDAWGYIANSAIASYEKNGFGLYRTALKDTDEAIGICGLVKRDGLDAPDVGFAFLERFWGKGYAVETAAAVIAHARETLGVKKLLAITALENRGSIAVLEKIGMRFIKTLRLPAHDNDSRLFEIDL
ncbi:MAG TPA: GNAT family N-acetyltransferase [Rhizomicrobium sp.]|nr:GNAT family N-acetyltransferase [Rhizomicrobium sp.]